MQVYLIIRPVIDILSSSLCNRIFHKQAYRHAENIKLVQETTKYYGLREVYKHTAVKMNQMKLTWRQILTTGSWPGKTGCSGT